MRFAQEMHHFFRLYTLTFLQNKMQNLICFISVTSVSQRGGRRGYTSRDEIFGFLVAEIQQKSHRKAFGQLYETMHPFIN